MNLLKDIRSVIFERFPVQCAEEWDNPGIQLGHVDAPIERVIVALELTREVANEAIERNAQLILTHHPFIFRPIKSVSDETPEGELLLMLAEHHIALLAAHTNLDAAPDCISQKLADDLGLVDRSVMLPSSPFDACKVIVFVPETHADDVAQAMHAQGAGCVGDYTQVSFRSKGQGYFTCGKDSHPAIGTPGSAETVSEVRIEMIASSRNLHKIIGAMLEAHPYEEPAYDVFKLQSNVHGMTDLYGFGVKGKLAVPRKLSDFVANIKKQWEIPALRVAGDLDKEIRTVAILNGSGARYLTKCNHIDAYITGDCGHHDFDNARRLGVALIDAGHYDTEKFIPQILADTLKSAYPDMDIQIARSMRNPYSIC